MHENELTQVTIGAAIEVHRCLGPGLLETVYEEALCHELYLRGIPFTRQQRVPISLQGIKLAAELRLDLLGANQVVVDLKAKESVTPVDKAQLLTYLRLCDLRLGLLINFHVVVLKDGICRVVNRLKEPPSPPNDVPDMDALASGF